MRDFSWQVFALTGNVDAYMLYRDIGENGGEETVEKAQEGERQDGDERQAEAN
ncbi:MAG TPA: YqzL family protein [Bacilli bacterium]